MLNLGNSKSLGKFAFIQNKECEFFPCHATQDIENFNCLFCFCPLYALGPNCGGDFTYNENGIKDCKGCIKPHAADGYDYVMTRISGVSELAKITIKKLDKDK